ncbi:MAG: tRNA lysidine(34) synthetase TilS [Bacteroidales bacterium]|jgi:tRNA(Ile)-lysidine synthase
MKNQLIQFIKEEKLFDKNSKILVAVSGGMDSVLLLHLLNDAGFMVAVVHCNFQLRGKESDGDETFVSQLVNKLDLPFHVKRFNTADYAEEKKISIQMAARELRYAWFEEVRIKNSYDFIAVAHHRDDEVETFFINLIRGSGIAGLHGIKPKTGNIVRPLMFADRGEIEAYVKKNKIKFREDSSNTSLKYMRNKIRHQLLPLMKELNPDIEKTVKGEIERLKQIESVFLEMVEVKRKEITGREGSLVKFDINKILSLSQKELFIYELLKPYGFSGNIIATICKSLKGEAGKQFFSSTHRLVKDRSQLIVSPNVEIESVQDFIITEGYKELKEPIHLKFKTISITKDFDVKIKDRSIAMFDAGKLKFPLTIRKWEKGDFFYPFGMRGKKKLSDFFTDSKFSLIDKENIWLLCNGDDIMWVIGCRTDNMYRITSSTKKVFVAEIIENNT